MRVVLVIDEVLGNNFATALEIAVKHLNSGCYVDMVVCRGDLLACPNNSRHEELVCRLCRSKLASALLAPAMSGVNVHELNFSADDHRDEVPEFSDVEGLKNYHVGTENLGLESASSVITVVRDPRPDLSGERQLVYNNVKTASALYRWCCRKLPELNPDIVYVLNGRRSSQMPVIRVARQLGIDIVTYENGHKAGNYMMVSGTYFHDLPRKKAEVDRYWESATSDDDRRHLAHQFFAHRRYGSGKEYPEAKFKDSQVRGMLPDGFSADNRNIVIFNSSEDEFAAVEGYENQIYPDQIVGLERILADERLSPELDIWLRVHPNLAGLRNSQVDAIAKLDTSRIHVIAPEDPIDSYILMEGAEKVITFGSAMGIESAYAGIPSILIGREAYEELGSCYTPASHDAVMDLINDPNLAALPIDGALKLGYFMVARDVPYKYYDIGAHSLMGYHIKPATLVWLESRIRWFHPIARLRSIIGRLLRRRFRRIWSLYAALKT